MPQNSIKFKTRGQRWLLIIPALLFLLGSVWAFSWFFANSIAANARQPEVAAAAVSLSPSDPLTHGRLAFLKSQSFVPNDLPEALQNYEQATALAPHDWRYWFALGRMHERLGNAEQAEAAAHRAVELAPNYAQIRWLLGNVLLRRGKTSEGLLEMRFAAESNSDFAVHFVNTVAQTLSTDDLKILKQVLGESETIRVALLDHLIQNKKLDHTMQLWQQLSEKEKQETSKNLAEAFLSAKRFRAAFQLYQQRFAETNAKPNFNQILNSSFEDENLDVGAQTNPFFWQIADGAQPQIAFDATQKHSGERSLILFFNSVSGTDFRNVSQLVAVEGGASYRLETLVKTADLKTSSTMRWEVVDAVNERVLTTTEAAPKGNSGDWHKMIADFKTENAAEAVILRLTRDVCRLPPCSITGKIWFDSFSLQKMDDTNN